MNKQEVFDSAVRQLKGMKNGRAGYKKDREFFCSYRSENGPCIAGAFIPDDVYEPWMENKRFFDLVKDTKWTGKKLPEWMYEPSMIDFIGQLQYEHDTEGNWNESGQFIAWSRLALIANINQLNTDILNND